MLVKKYKGYGEYFSEQVAAAIEKKDHVWAQDDVLLFVTDFIVRNYGRNASGICHGVRTGYETDYLKSRIRGSVIGTDLVATREDILKWDMHEVMPEWIGRFDFVYSNALDHSYKPSECVLSWISCLIPGGSCIVEWSINNTKVSGADCFAASLDEIVALVAGYEVETVKIPEIRCHTKRKTHLIIIKNKKAVAK